MVKPDFLEPDGMSQTRKIFVGKCMLKAIENQWKIGQNENTILHAKPFQGQSKPGPPAVILIGL
jgi:hypothetical protein